MTPHDNPDDLSAARAILTALAMAVPFWVGMFFLGGWWAR